MSINPNNYQVIPDIQLPSGIKGLKRDKNARDPAYLVRKVINDDEAVIARKLIDQSIPNYQEVLKVTGNAPNYMYSEMVCKSDKKGEPAPSLWDLFDSGIKPKLSSVEIYVILSQVAFAAIHFRKVRSDGGHHDLKPQNILVEDQSKWKVTLVDFEPENRLGLSDLQELGALLIYLLWDKGRKSIYERNCWNKLDQEEVDNRSWKNCIERLLENSTIKKVIEKEYDGDVTPYSLIMDALDVPPESGNDPARILDWIEDVRQALANPPKITLSSRWLAVLVSLLIPIMLSLLLVIGFGAGVRFLHTPTAMRGVAADPTNTASPTPVVPTATSAVTETVIAQATNTSTPDITPSSTPTVSVPPSPTSSPPLVPPNRNLAIGVSGPEKAIAGAGISYTVTITNSGGVTVTGVIVEHDVKKSIDDVKFDLNSGECKLSTGNCTLESLGVSATVAIVISGVVKNDFDPGAPLTFEATILNEAEGMDQTDNKSAITATIDIVAEISTVSEAHPNPAAPEVPLVVSSIITNNGPSTLRDVTIRLTEPGWLDHLAMNQKPCELSGQSNIYECKLDKMTPGIPVSLVATGTVPSTIEGSIMANIALDAGAGQEIRSGSSISIPVEVNPVADAVVILTGPPSVTLSATGETAYTYTVALTNSGPSALVNAILTLTLPVEVTSFGTLIEQCSLNNLELICHVDRLGRGESQIYQLPVQVSDDVSASQEISSSVRVRADTDQNAFDNNEWAITTRLIVPPDVSLSPPITRTPSRPVLPPIPPKLAEKICPDDKLNIQFDQAIPQDNVLICPADSNNVTVRGRIDIARYEWFELRYAQIGNGADSITAESGGAVMDRLRLTKDGDSSQFTLRTTWKDSPCAESTEPNDLAPYVLWIKAGYDQSGAVPTEQIDLCAVVFWGAE